MWRIFQSLVDGVFGGWGVGEEWWWEGGNETRKWTAWADCKLRAVFLFGLSQSINILFYVRKVI